MAQAQLERAPKHSAAEWAAAVVSWRRLLGLTMGASTVSVLGRIGGERVPQGVTRWWSDQVVRGLGIELVADGLDRAAAAAPCIIVANHCSQLDIPVVGAVLEIDYRWVAKKELFRLPFVGWHLTACGHIPVNRQKGGNFDRMIAQIDAVLERGLSVLFFPEGTRSQDGAMKSFRSGAFNVAVRTGVPVLPVVIDGTERLLEKGSIRYPGRGAKRVQVRVLEAIAPPEPAAGQRFEDRVAALKKQTRDAMIATLDELRGAEGAALRPTR